MKNDLISRQMAIDAFETAAKSGASIEDIKLIMAEMPSIQPERKTGRWILVTSGRGGYECSCCHEYAPSYRCGEDRLSNFCPNCGADMRGEKDG